MSALATIQHETPAHLMPAFSIDQAVTRFNCVVEFVQKIMKPNIDFGVIPGTNKPTLLKAGAEKLTTFFGLSKRFEIIEKIEDWSGAQHDSEPFFYYLYRCQLFHGNTLIAEADGSCNSREGKYRWRKAERTCPTCGAAAIIKGKTEYGGGWVCFAKKGGCGAKFPDFAPEIIGQQVGRVVNPDVADQVNTIQKMAQKRALIAATLLAVNASEFFTQDIEDLAIEAEIIEAEPSEAHRQPHAEERAPRPQKPAIKSAQPAPGPSGAMTASQQAAIVKLCEATGWGAEELAREEFSCTFAQLKQPEAGQLIQQLQAELDKRRKAA